MRPSEPLRPRLLSTGLLLCCLFAASIALAPSEFCSRPRIASAAPNPSTHCSSASLETEAQAVARIVDYAPYVFFHPLEQYNLARVDRFLQNADIFDLNGAPLGPATEANLLRQSADPTSESFFVSGKDRTSLFNSSQPSNATSGYPYISGEGFDSQNRSLAHIYATAFPSDNNGTTIFTWVFNYWLFYSWNGCSNQDLLTRSIRDQGKQILLSYQACDLGVHEGDIEHISVEVCGDLSSILRVSYGQHGWNEQQDCTAGQCRFESGTHPLVYSALNSHASYPIDSFSNVYLQVTTDVIDNLIAFSLADRTLRGSRYFEPRADNVQFINASLLRDSVNISSLITARDAYPSGAADDWVHLGPSWAVFAGRFGVSYSSVQRTLTDPQCYLNNQSSLVSCPNSQLLAIGEAILGAASSRTFKAISEQLKGVTEEIYQSLSDTINNWGPLAMRTKGYAVSWEGPVLPPLGNKTAICPTPSLLIAAEPPPVFPETKNGLVLASVFGSVCAALAAVVITIAACSHYDAVTGEETQKAPSNAVERAVEAGGVAIADSIGLNTQRRTLARDVFRSIPWLSLLALSVAVVGYILSWTVIQDVFSTLEVYLSTKYWADVRRVFEAYTPIALVIDTVATITAIFLTGRTFELLCLKRNGVKRLKRRLRFTGSMRRLGMFLQLVLIALVVAAMLLSIGVIGFGAVSLVGVLVLKKPCDVSAGVLDGVCVNLEDFGLDQVYCGDDLSLFCARWQSVDIPAIIVGAVLLHLAQVTFLVIAVDNLRRFRAALVAKAVSEEARAKGLPDPAESASQIMLGSPSQIMLGSPSQSQLV